MSAGSFATHLFRVRDQGLPFEKSWRMRNNDEDDDHFIEMSAVTSLGKMTTDDLLWCFTGAVMHPTATHLLLMIFPGDCEEPDETFERLLTTFEVQHRFEPHQLDLVLAVDECSMRSMMIISLFSIREEIFGDLLADNA